MPLLEVSHIEKSYSNKNGQFHLGPVSLQVQKGETLAIIGSSGCGKSTILRLICGLEKCDKGSISLNEIVISDVNRHAPPEKRNIGMVFQQFALFPHLTVEENILFGLKKLSKHFQQKKLNELLGLVRLQDKKDRYPHQLSGGEQQRVALARSLAPEPSLIMLDEPFSNLDELIKDKVRQDVKNTLKHTGATTILVTHDLHDAFILADSIIVIENGKIVQHGTPFDLYHRPSNQYVARMLGSVNILDAHLEEERLSTRLGKFALKNLIDFKDAHHVAIRPEYVVMNKQFNAEALEARISDIHFYGDKCEVHLQINSDSGPFELISHKRDMEGLQRGDRVSVSIMEEGFSPIRY